MENTDTLINYWLSTFISLLTHPVLLFVTFFMMYKYKQYFYDSMIKKESRLCRAPEIDKSIH